MNKKQHTIFLKLSFLLVAFCFSIYSFAQKTDKIELLKANSLEFDQTLGSGAKRLIGDVAFKHNDAIMYCDSAYLFAETNSLKAYGHIHINQNDSTHIYGDILNYYGEKKLANILGKVTMLDKEMTLTSSQLDYDLNKNLAYYSTGGKIISSKNQNTLTSVQGYYYTDSKLMFYKDRVVLINPQMEIKTDTLKFNTIKDIAFFEGPTQIIGKKDFIYCENGWYDTKKNIAQFKKNAYLLSDNKKLSGDSLYYDRNSGFGKAIKNVQITDTIENITINGDYASHNEKTNTSFVTGNLLMTLSLEKDSLFLHADTLKMITDSIRKDKNIFAYHKVKFYKSDLSGLCDSLAYNLADSMIKMFKKPILWSENKQITAESISVKTFDGKIEKMIVKNNAFIISQEDSLKFNQIFGNNMIGFFDKNKLNQVNASGNCQTFYYGKENDGSYLGLNKTESSELIIYLKENSIDKITYINKPKAILTPIEEVIYEDSFLKGFKWLNHLKPSQKNDIFNWK